MFDGITLVRPDTPAAVPATPRSPHPDNLLLNPRFEPTDTPRGAWCRPAAWQAAVRSPVGGVVTAACPAALTDRACHGAGVAWVYDGLHAPGACGTATALSQTLSLPAGSYRFGGRLALRVWDAALDATGRRVLNASRAFLRLVGAVATGPRPGTADAAGTLLGAIDLSPQRFAAGDFRRGPAAGALVRFAYLPFHTHARTFALDVAEPVTVTVQLGVVPVASDDGIEGGRLVPLTHVTVLAEHVFVERIVG